MIRKHPIRTALVLIALNDLFTVLNYEMFIGEWLTPGLWTIIASFGIIAIVIAFNWDKFKEYLKEDHDPEYA